MGQYVLEEELLGTSMYEHENFAHDLARALEILKWPLEQLEKKLGNRYSIRFLRQVFEGKPYPGVERDIAYAVSIGFADKVECAVGESGLPVGAGAAARQAYLDVVDQFSLRLHEMATLAEKICGKAAQAQTLRTQTIDLANIVTWYSILGSMARDLSQGKLFLGDSYLQVNEESSLLLKEHVSVHETPTKVGLSRFNSEAPHECANCHLPAAELRHTKCLRCGYNWVNSNW